MKIVIIVPAFNEEKMIKAVLSDLRGKGYKNIVVVDDGSTDQTSTKAGLKGVVVLRHVVNRGLGAALGTGFEYAKAVGAEMAVTFDADGQHRAKDILKLVTPIKKKQADVVVGSRVLWKQKKMPRERLALNYLSNLATLLFYGVWATDTLSGLRAFNKKALESIKIRTQGMEVSNEFFKEIKRNQLKYLEVPIEPIYTDYSIESSSQGEFASLRIVTHMLLRLFR